MLQTPVGKTQVRKRRGPHPTEKVVVQRVGRALEQVGRNLHIGQQDYEEDEAGDVDVDETRAPEQVRIIFEHSSSTACNLLANARRCKSVERKACEHSGDALLCCGLGCDWFCAVVDLCCVYSGQHELHLRIYSDAFASFSWSV